MLDVETYIDNDPAVYVYLVTAKMDILGQCSTMRAHVSEHSRINCKHIYLDLQKEHESGRFSVHVASNAYSPYMVMICTKTPGYEPHAISQIFGLEGMLSWHFCSKLGRRVTADTKWEFWVSSQKLMCISFRMCEDNKQEIIGESFVPYNQYKDKEEEH